MYFSQEQIKQSTKRLQRVHPFFGTVFLAFKQAQLPVGETQRLNFQELLRKFLERYYQPDPNHDGFYIPFKTSTKNKRWMTPQYISTLTRMTGSAFADAFIHPKGSQDWGWQTDYVNTLLHTHLQDNKLPAFDLAVWLLRDRDWGEKPQAENVLDVFFTEFSTFPENNPLFNISFPSSSQIFYKEYRNTEIFLFSSKSKQNDFNNKSLASLDHFPPNLSEIAIQELAETFRSSYKSNLNELMQSMIESIQSQNTLSFPQISEILNQNIIKAGSLYQETFKTLYQASTQSFALNFTKIIQQLPLFSSARNAKIYSLKLQEVGPSPELEIDFASRLNVITGDNALGKTFLLECVWWALTNTWASQYPAHPRPDAKNPTITYQIGREFNTENNQTVQYNWRAQRWADQAPHKALSGLSIFAQADGSFAIWDPAKLDLQQQLQEENDAFLRIQPDQVWRGVQEERNDKIVVRCRGLIEDWITWQTAADQTRFHAFCKALETLSPHPNQPLRPGQPIRMLSEERDARDIPTLEFPYGPVPITLCSAGIKRIVALAYMLVWTWHEHLLNSELIHEEPQESMVLLIDEMEAHLHPFWQRVIVPAIMNVVQKLATSMSTQVIIATHSPLVLASMEPFFDEEQDSLFHLYLDIENGEVQLNATPFVKRGPINQWLTSEIFGLAEPRSKAAEETINEAKQLELSEDPSIEQIQRISDRLRQVLAPDDEFWPLWGYFARERGVRI